MMKLKPTWSLYIHKAIDKAANKYASVCKMFYINRVVVEFGIFSNSNTATYLKADTWKEAIT